MSRISQGYQLLKKIVFLDRDGVINFDSAHYIKTVEEFKFIPGSLPAIAKLSRYGYLVFVISNQSGIARGLIRKRDLDKIHNHLLESVQRTGGKLEDVYFCPHHPDQGCDCRKPRPGLIHQAAREHHLDVRSSIMIGDKLTDIECAENAGCRQAYLVKTGIENQSRFAAEKFSPMFYRTAGTLFHAADIIIAEDETKTKQP